MMYTTQTVGGVTGTVTDVNSLGQITQIESGGKTYEPCPISGRFYAK